MIERIAVLMMSVGLCASMAQAAIVAIGDVEPADPAAWGTSTTAYIGKTGAGSVTVDDDSDVGSESSFLGYHSSSTGAVTVSGAGSTWTNGGLTVGEDGDGTLDITNGGAVSNTSAHLAYGSGSTGAVTVSGSGSTWTNGSLTVGREGDGTLDITDGGVVSNTNGEIGYRFGTGAVTVSGAGSTWTNSGKLIVGTIGAGTLNIADGGLVEVSQDTHVATYSGPGEAPSAINFDNGTLRTGGLVGAAGDLSGTGRIDTNGLASDVDLVFDAARGLTQTLTLKGPGQNITVNLNVDGSGSMGAGYGGEGSMHVSDGLAVESTNGYLGYKSGSTGAARVSGAGAAWTNSGYLYVGMWGDGTLDITDGAAVSNTESNIACISGSTSTVTVSGDGSTWTNSGNLCVGYYGQAALNIDDGGLVSVAGDLTIDHDGGGDSFINMGAGGMLALDGNAAGSLTSFLGLIGGSDAIRYWDESSWGWVDITGATPGVDYTLEYETEGDLDGYTVLTVTTPTAASMGDTNGDDIVDGFDLAIFNAQLGLRGPGMSCDFDGDDDVDLEDFAILRSYFGSGVVSAPDAEFAAATPEPATIILLAGGLPMLLKRRRRRG